MSPEEFAIIGFIAMITSGVVALVVSGLVSWLKAWKIEKGFYAAKAAVDTLDARMTSFENRNKAYAAHDKRTARKEALMNAAPGLMQLLGNKEMSSEDKKKQIAQLITENPELIDVALAKMGVKL